MIKKKTGAGAKYFNKGFAVLVRALGRQLLGCPGWGERHGKKQKRFAPASETQFTISRWPLTWYECAMNIKSGSAVKHYLRGGGAVLFLCVAHVAHDFIEKDNPLQPSIWASMAIVLQAFILFVGYAVVERRGWMGKNALFVAVLFSMVWGWLVVRLHVPVSVKSPELVWFWYGITGLIVLGCWMLVFYFPKKLDDERERVLVAESARAKAELAQLRSNLHPHFLLNTLNTVAGLTTADAKKARNVLAALGDLLRDSLEDSSEMVSLQSEMAWLERYVEIIEARYAERIAFKWDVDDASTSAMVPRMLLQPLVENAIEHGALRRDSPGVVRICAGVDGRDIHMDISDNGPGMNPLASEGVGLKLVRERLVHTFPGASMTIHAAKPGCRVSLVIPGALT
ncbi:MAG: histidine kinase [Deltaproteobacteria bacterium]|nr:histidine kinase [Deltaproteobacteria bacterium]